MSMDHERVATTIGYMPEEERCTAYYLFSRAERYMCRVKLMDLRSVEHIRFFGTPTAGDEDYDREMRNEVVDRLFTIAEMACYFRDGISIWVRHKADTKKIYERITDHLIQWKAEMEKLNHRKIPVEDLLVLDEFAHKVYEHAKWQFRDPYTMSLMEQSLANRFGGFLSAASPEMPTVDNPPPAREGFTDEFVHHRQTDAGSMPKFSLNGQPLSPFAEPVSPNTLPGALSGTGDANAAMSFGSRFGQR